MFLENFSDEFEGIKDQVGGLLEQEKMSSEMSKEDMVKKLTELEDEYLKVLEEARELWVDFDNIDDYYDEFIERSKEEFIDYYKSKRSGILGDMLGASDCIIKRERYSIIAERISKKKVIKMIINRNRPQRKKETLFTSDFFEEDQYDFKLESDMDDRVFLVSIYKPFAKVPKSKLEASKWQNISESMNDLVLKERYSAITNAIPTVKGYINPNMANEFIWRWEGSDYNYFEDMIYDMGL